MALSIEQKKAVIAEVAGVANKALAAVAAEYRGMTVEEMTELRAQARNDGVFLKVAKNTLVHRAVEGTEYECMQESLTGPLLFAFSMEDPGAAARLVKAYAKDHDNLIVKLVAVGGGVVRRVRIDTSGQLADLRSGHRNVDECDESTDREIRADPCRTSYQVGSDRGCRAGCKTGCLKFLTPFINHTVGL